MNGKGCRRTVTRVIDGDTVQVARKIGPSNIVRLSGYNAPERGSPGGENATRRLRGMIGGETVTVRPKAVDKYGRVVGEVIHDRKNVADKMTRRR